jgi:hypothetical protein
MADLGHDDQVVGVGRERGVDQLVRGSPRREIEGGGVDVVHAELDRAAQDADDPLTVARGSAGAGGEPHRAEPDPVDGAVAEPPGTRV